MNNVRSQEDAIQILSVDCAGTEHAHVGTKPSHGERKGMQRVKYAVTLHHLLIEISAAHSGQMMKITGRNEWSNRLLYTCEPIQA
ncbi:hypothetical protein A1332_12595 [Methylomonas methanica]|uniref:Uncharacterized protein n=1 Tax=Methylomonas methanica TaxID=421 RepID=A0A177ML28_METMH|nr:hypothetical protein A1332_12595 [Methylomonas methanica]